MNRRLFKLYRAINARISLVAGGKMNARKFRRWCHWNREVDRLKRRTPMRLESADQRRLLARLNAI